MTEEKRRFFTIDSSSIGFTGGRFKVKVGKGSRGSAAKKAGKRLFQIVKEGRYNNNSSKPQRITFELREVTKGSDHKVTKYSAVLKKLNTPRERQFPNPKDPSNPIIVKYNNEVVVQAIQ